MIHEALGRSLPIELTSDRRVTLRVRRLAAISIVALGLVWGLASATLEAPWVIGVILALGWLLMPAVLLWSLVAPGARYLLLAPASLVLVGLLAICIGWLPTSPIAAAGWVLLTAGVALGGVLGLWFWFRIAPVPTALNEPDAHGRWTLIGVHVALITVGWALAATALLPA
ncbi:MAG TPA: hypothetical protein VIK31_12815 [Propionibacteriaceae bacterium]